MAGDRPWLAVLVVLADAGPDNQNAGEGRNSAEHVNHARAGKVAVAQFGQPAPAIPYPMGHYRVDEAGDERCVDEVGHELDATGNRPGNDGGGSRRKYDLEQPLRAAARIVEEEPVSVGEETTHRRTAIGESKAKRPVHDAADREVHEILHDDVAGVLGPGEPGLDERKPRLHEHHQGCGHYQPHLIDCGPYLGRGGGLGGGTTCQRTKDRQGDEGERHCPFSQHLRLPPECCPATYDRPVSPRLPLDYRFAKVVLQERFRDAANPGF